MQLIYMCSLNSSQDFCCKLMSKTGLVLLAWTPQFLTTAADLSDSQFFDLSFISPCLWELCQNNPEDSERQTNRA